MFTLDMLSKYKKHDVNGYYRYYIPEHHLANKCGFVYEHQIMAEQKLGRELNPGEVVHHNDRNRHNNSLENLIVFKTSSNHTAYHGGRDIVLDGDVYVSIDIHAKDGEYKNECPYCGKLKCVDAKMCLDCYNKEQAKNIPPKEELYNYLKDKSMCAIGKIYGVSDNAVRKWCKKYDLPFKRDDIEKFREKEFGIVKTKKIKQKPTPKKALVMFDDGYNFLDKFESVGRAAAYLGNKNKRCHITEVCNGKREIAYGYRWMWLEDYQKEQSMSV